MYSFYESVMLIVWHLLPTLTAVLVSGWLLQRFFIRKSNAASLADSILGELQTLRNDSLDYWSLSDPDKEIVLASQLKGSIQTISADIDYYCIHYKINKETKSHFDILQISLADAVTGGDFEQKKRKANPYRYLTILNVINKIRSEIHKTKI